VAGADGVAEADGLDPDEPVDAEGDEPVEPVVEVVVVLVVDVVLVVPAGAAVEVGTVNGGTSEVSVVADPPPQAARPADNATPVSRAARKVLVRERLGTVT
jgi:hypothetical protein